MRGSPSAASAAGESASNTRSVHRRARPFTGDRAYIRALGLRTRGPYYPRVAKTKKKLPTKAARAGAKKNRKPAANGPHKGSVRMREPHLRWLDSVAESIRVSGGPSFSREDVLEALVDATTSRTIDPRTVRSREALRVAFGALDTTK